MPSRTKLKNAAIAERSAALPKIPQELLDQFVQGPMTAEAIQDATMALKKALIERALGGELSHHLGYPPGGDKPAEAGNHRNGSTGKTVLTEDGPLRIEVQHDREGSHLPRDRQARLRLRGHVRRAMRRARRGFRTRR